MINKLAWIRSSYSGSQGGQCVEVAALPDGSRAVRDSKDQDGPVLRFTAEQWKTFTSKIKSES